MVSWEFCARACLHTAPGGLRAHRIPQDLAPHQSCTIEVASENSNRLYSTVIAVVVRLAHHMRPQGLEDGLSSAVGEITSLAGWAMDVTYV